MLVGWLHAAIVDCMALCSDLFLCFRIYLLGRIDLKETLLAVGGTGNSDRVEFVGYSL